MQPPGELTSADLLAYARDRGRRVSKRQLKAWRDAGLLPRPRRQSLGRARGVEWRYPAAAADQLVAAAEAVARWRRLDLAAYVLLSEGYPVTRAVTRDLLDSLDQSVRFTRNQVSRHDAEHGDTLIDASEKGRLPAQLAHLWPARRVVGKRQCSTLVRAVFADRLGDFDRLGYADVYFDPSLSAALDGLMFLTRRKMCVPLGCLVGGRVGGGGLPAVLRAVESSGDAWLEQEYCRNRLRELLGGMHAADFPSAKAVIVVRGWLLDHLLVMRNLLHSPPLDGDRPDLADVGVPELREWIRRRESLWPTWQGPPGADPPPRDSGSAVPLTCSDDARGPRPRTPLGQRGRI